LVGPINLFIFQDVRVLIKGFGGFPMLAIEFIVFACYPPRSEPSHDGGLVDLFVESHKPSDLSPIFVCLLILYGFQGGTLKETRV
jgi:hypothetical protein